MINNKLVDQEILDKHLDNLIDRAKRNLKQVDNLGNWLIGYSGGKDSMIPLHIALLEYGNDITVVFEDTLIEFRETYDFLNIVKNLFHLKKFHILKPNQVTSAKTGKRMTNTFFRLLNQRQYGLWTMAKRRPCCNELKKKPLKKFMDDNFIQIAVTGILSEESKRRSKLGVIDWVSIEKRKKEVTELDFLGNTFNRKIVIEDIGYISGNIILNWTSQDIWNYHKRYNLPHNKIYDMGHENCGCWACPCPNKARDYYSLLLNSHPKLYKAISNVKYRGNHNKKTFYRHTWEDGVTNGK